MAGGYRHIVSEDDGRFVDHDDFVNMIESLGDAYEMAEEMFGMIWYLAARQADPAEAIEVARVNYKAGLNIARIAASNDPGGES